MLKENTLKNKAKSHISGFGLRSPHVDEVIERLPQAGFLEIHSENYFAQGGKTVKQLKQIAEHYPLSFHGVALSLGSSEEPCKEHLARLKKLVDTYNPAMVSEHIAWNISDDVYLNDLLPVPYTEEAAKILSRNIDIVQNEIGRNILIENPSAYLSYKVEGMASEGDFIKEVIQNTNCGLLLDVNNVYVSCRNMNTDPIHHLNNMPFDKVGEIHLAGHSVKQFEDGEIRIDTHSKTVCDDVWKLYEHTLSKTSRVPTLIEWDIDIPELDILLGEADKATQYLQKAKERCDDAA